MYISANSKWYLQVTTFSRLLTAPDLEQLEQLPHPVELISLQQFETEQSFLKKIRFVLIFIFSLSEDFVQNFMICIVWSI